MTKIITIAIPTYNRAQHVATLLRILKSDLQGHEHEVDILISDNASTDETPEVVADFLRSYPAAVSLRNETNLGPDGNIAQCFNHAQSEYVWVLGDDDAPGGGVVTALIRLLKLERPDMVYLKDRWMPEVNEVTRGRLSGTLQYIVLSRLDFARQVGTSFTFISSNVIKRSVLDECGTPLIPGKLLGSSLIQMEWTFSALRDGDKFIYVRSNSVAATAGNTGGYGVLKTFLRVYMDIISQMFATQPQIAKALITRHILGNLAPLLWALRTTTVGKFLPESDQAIYVRLRRYALYWMLLWPIYHLPKGGAWPFRMFGKLLLKLVILRDRWALPENRYLAF